MSPLLYRLGSRSARHPWRTMSLVGLALASLVALVVFFGGSPKNTTDLPGTSSDSANQLLERHFPTETNAHAYIAARWDNSLDQSSVEAAVADVEELRGVNEAVARPSKDEPIVAIAVTYDRPLSDLDAAAETQRLETAAEPLRDSADTVAIGGQLPESIQGPDGTAEAVGVAVALLILLFAFGSVLAAGFPLLIAGIGVGAGMCLIGLISAVTDVNAATPTLGAMIGLGVGIDYALFVVSAYRTARHHEPTSVAAAATATATAGRSVTIAGVTVLVGLLGLALCGVPSFTTMGLAAGLVVVCEVVLAVTVLPALLGRFGHRMRRSRRDQAKPATWAYRLATTVTRRPVLWLVGGLVVLAVLAVPATQMRLGENDAGSEAADNPTRIAYDLMSNGFGPGHTGPLSIVVDRDEVSGDAMAKLRTALGKDSDVAQLTPQRESPDGEVAVFEAIPQSRPGDAATQALVHRTHELLPNGAELTGKTAINVDMADRLGQRMWLVIAVVLVLSFALLVVMLRSLLIPLKAVAVNLLAVAAAFGVLTLAFQTETGANLVGLHGPVPIAGWAPLVLFAVLFGLSMDYEIFLLSRVKDAYDKTRHPTGSIVAGMADAAGLITAAAAIMIAVALGFALDASVMVKIIGVGMAAALLLDATVVRLVLVPATMTLLGRHNWWMPRPLRRLLRESDAPSAAEKVTPGTISADKVPMA